ncbi:hypothetical protein ILUMI_08265, partial [Ignelater luminosus]
MPKHRREFWKIIPVNEVADLVSTIEDRKLERIFTCQKPELLGPLMQKVTASTSGRENTSVLLCCSAHSATRVVSCLTEAVPPEAVVSPRGVPLQVEQASTSTVANPPGVASTSTGACRKSSEELLVDMVKKEKNLKQLTKIEEANKKKFKQAAKKKKKELEKVNISKPDTSNKINTDDEASEQSDQLSVHDSNDDYDEEVNGHDEKFERNPNLTRAELTLDSVGYIKNRQVFTDVEEEALASYLKKAADMYYGLTLYETRKLAYQFAIKSNKAMPDSWRTKLLAGEDWLGSFLKRHPSLSIRTPQATSLSR